MEKVFRTREANWEIKIEDYDICTVKMDGNIIVEGIRLNEALIFISKWHEPITLVKD